MTAAIYLRKASAALRDVAEGRPVSPAELLRLADKIEPRRRRKVLIFKPVKTTRPEKMSMGEIRRIVMDRAQGWCEACGTFSAVSMDHWEGGSGRRTQHQSPETCWALCIFCDRERTHNRPSAAHWNMIREKHCEKYGFRFVPHVEHQKVARRRAR